jgi:hypothetical protein
MSLADEYPRQLAWRSWPTILDELPLHPGQKVLDLGRAAGDLAAELVARGAFAASEAGLPSRKSTIRSLTSPSPSRPILTCRDMLARRSRRAATIFTWGASCKAPLGSRDSRSRSS